MKDIGEVIQAISIGLIVANFLLTSHRVLKTIEICKECLVILNEVGEGKLAKRCYKAVYLTMLKAYFLINDYTNAIKYGSKLLHIHRQCGEKAKECNLSIELATLYLQQGKFAQAREICEKALIISTEIGDRNSEASCYENLGTVYQSFGKFEKAREYHEVALAVRKEIGDRSREGAQHENLGIVYYSLGDNVKAKEYLEKALTIHKKTGDRKGEASSSGNLGSVYQSVGEYEKAGKYLEEALGIRKEIGDREGEASSYGNLGTVYQSRGEYVKARQYHEKALTISKEIGDKCGEATDYGNLGAMFLSLGDYTQAKTFLEKALALKRETGDRNGVASSYANLGALYKFTGEYEKAVEYHEKALEIVKEIGARKDEASCYGHLGNVYRSVGKYEKAIKYHTQALMIRKETGDKKGEASSYGNLGAVFQSLGEYEKARKHYEQSLELKIKIGDRTGEGADHGNLGSLFQSLGEYAKANEHLQTALEIQKETGERGGEATSYGNLGNVFQSLGDYVNAKDYYEKALAIRRDIGDRAGEAADYANLGSVLQSLGEYVKAEEYQKKGLAIAEGIGDVEKQFSFLCKLAWVKYSQGTIQEARSYLLQSIQKCEALRSFIRDSDQFKISFSDKHVFPYWLLSELFCTSGNLNEALYVAELGRARALADLMSAQYSMENEISTNPQSWFGIEKVLEKECNASCLCTSYSTHNMLLLIVKASGVQHLRRIDIKEMNVQEGMIPNLNDFFDNQSVRGFSLLSEENCEDRSLNSLQQKPKSFEEDSSKTLRIGKDGEGNQEPTLNLPLCHRLIIAPVAELFDSPEIIIVPDRSLYNIPFPALPDESGKYLSETYRIRIVPSLTTLKLIQDSPVDYHSQTGALIVGNPDVGQVRYKGRRKLILPLPCAENEAKMIARKLGVTPLLGKEATKEAVIKGINSVSLIHFAAHGDSEKGEIALAPAPAPHTPNRIPREQDYLLTMSDISKVQLRAKLVVLSCCHSGRGQIRADGIVGMARAFLGSGARSVLVALWALDDKATAQFMNRFYEHLVRGESSSEALHEAMKWMRYNGYSDVRHWAPFMLIGDNVAFDFRK